MASQDSLSVTLAAVGPSDRTVVTGSWLLKHVSLISDEKWILVGVRPAGSLSEMIQAGSFNTSQLLNKGMSDSENPIYYSTHTWNLALSIASVALDYTEETYETIGDRSYETIGETFTYLSSTYDEYEQSGDTEIWPFENLFDLVEMVDEHVGLEEEGRPINNLASAISTRITESPKYQHRPADTESKSAESNTEEPESPLDEFDEVVSDIAHDLYRCFVTYDDGITFREVQSRYDHQFPKRSVTQLSVANSKGKTETDRLASIAEWVDTWLGSDQEVQDIDQFAQRPMGQPIGN